MYSSKSTYTFKKNDKKFIALLKNYFPHAVIDEIDAVPTFRESFFTLNDDFRLVSTERVVMVGANLDDVLTYPYVGETVKITCKNYINTALNQALPKYAAKHFPVEQMRAKDKGVVKRCLPLAEIVLNNTRSDGDSRVLVCIEPAFRPDDYIKTKLQANLLLNQLAKQYKITNALDLPELSGIVIQCNNYAFLLTYGKESDFVSLGGLTFDLNDGFVDNVRFNTQEVMKALNKYFEIWKRNDYLGPVIPVDDTRHDYQKSRLFQQATVPNSQEVILSHSLRAS